MFQQNEFESISVDSRVHIIQFIRYSLFWLIWDLLSGMPVHYFTNCHLVVRGYARRTGKLFGFLNFPLRVVGLRTRPSAHWGLKDVLIVPPLKTNTLLTDHLNTV